MLAAPRGFCLILVSALGLAGCSISMPMGSLVSHADDDVTGSIPSHAFLDHLVAEDKRRAKAAMTTALDPQGSGTTVAWNNPDTGSKGSFVPVGKAYPANDRVCRAFLADMSLKATDKSVQGTACADKDGNWAVTESKPWKKT